MNVLLASLKETVREAWLTLAALPDPDARFRRGLGFGWVFQTVDAYKSDDPTRCKPTPSPEDVSEAEAVFEWLSWLRRQRPPSGGKFSIIRIGRWASGMTNLRMAEIEGCSEKTIRNRIDRSVAEILSEFIAPTIDERTEACLLPMAASAANIVPINELAPRRERIRGFAPIPERPIAGPLEDAGKVYIAGVGMMFRGKKYRSTCDVADESRGKRRR